MICPECKGRRFIRKEYVTPPLACGKSGLIEVDEQLCTRCLGTGTVELNMSVVKIGEIKK